MIQRSPVNVFVLMALVLAPCLPAGAQTRPSEQEYTTCMTLARTDPEEALKQAEAQITAGGGTPALHCKATALSDMGEAEAAAEILEEAARTETEVDLKVELLRQAVSVWGKTLQTKRVSMLLEEILKITPQDAETLENRAILRVTSGDLQGGLDDLDRIIAEAPEYPSALVLRAATYRRMGAFDKAWDDVRQIQKLDPHNPDALIEQGLLLWIDGKKTEARTAWTEVIEKFPDSLAAASARLNLEELDARAD